LNVSQDFSAPESNSITSLYYGLPTVFFGNWFNEGPGDQTAYMTPVSINDASKDVRIYRLLDSGTDSQVSDIIFELLNLAPDKFQYLHLGIKGLVNMLAYRDFGLDSTEIIRGYQQDLTNSVTTSIDTGVYIPMDADFPIAFENVHYQSPYNYYSDTTFIYIAAYSPVDLNISENTQQRSVSNDQIYRTSYDLDPEIIMITNPTSGYDVDIIGVEQGTMDLEIGVWENGQFKMIEYKNVSVDDQFLGKLNIDGTNVNQTIKVYKANNSTLDYTVTPNNINSKIFQVLSFEQEGLIDLDVEFLASDKIDSAQLEIQGFEYYLNNTTGGYPTSPSLDIGNDTIKEWEYQGQFNETVLIDVADYLNEQIINCTTDNGKCKIQMLFGSDSEGVLKISLETTLASDVDEIPQFYDDFEDNNSDSWNLITSDIQYSMTGQKTVKTGSLNGQGNYVFEMDVPNDGTDVNDYGIAMYKNGLDLDNYRLEFDSRIDYIGECCGYAYINLVFDSQSATDFENSYWAIIAKVQDKIYLLKRVNGEYTSIVETPYTINPNVVYHVGLERSNNNIKIYIDENLVIDVNDSTYASGTFGIGTSTAGLEHVKSSFDNVVITSLNGTNPIQQPTVWTNYHADSSPEDSGWSVSSSGTTTLASTGDGLLRLNDSVNSDYKQYGFYTDLNNTEGYIIEANFKVSQNTDGRAARIYFGDDVYDEYINFYPDKISSHRGNFVDMPVDNTKFNIYRIAVKSNTYEIYRNGELFVSASLSEHSSKGDPGVGFGSGSTSGTGYSVWDYIRFEKIS